MNKSRKRLAAVAGVGALAVGVALASPSGTQAFGQVPGARAQARAQKRGHVEAHPEVNRAIINLEQAKIDTQRAARDFGGHRAKASALISQAIEELKIAKKYDNTH